MSAEMQPESTLRLSLLGEPRLQRGGQIVALRLNKAIALLSYLAVTGQPQPRDVLAELLWPEAAPGVGRTRLRRVLYRLAQALGPGFIRGDADRLGIAPSVDLDVNEYNARVAEGLGGRGEGVAASLQVARSLYRGHFMHGFYLPDCAEFEAWRLAHQEALLARHSELLSHLIRMAAGEGNLEQALDLARQLVALDPLEESSHRRLIELYRQAGKDNAARVQFAECARILERELAVQPRPETAAAVQDLSTGLPGNAKAETRYTASKGVHIAYQVIGEGPVELLLIPGFVSHLEQFWLEPQMAEFLVRLAGMSRLVVLDRRGMGLSDRTAGPPTAAATCADVLAVLEAADSEQPVLFGVSEGGTMAMEFAARYPRRIRGLVLFGAMARGLAAPDYPWAMQRDAAKAWLDRLVAQWGGPVGLERFAPTMVGNPQFCDWWARTLRLGSSPGAMRFVLEALAEADVRPLLASLRAPALVMHREGDRAVPLEAGRHLARLIPNATWHPLAGDDHWPWIGNADAVLAALDQFLARTASSSACR